MKINMWNFECCYCELSVAVIHYLSNSNTVVHKTVFMIDLDYMHSIKHLADDLLSLGCTT